MTRKLIVEAIGTLFLVLTIGLVGLQPTPPGFAALAIGAVLTVLVYAGGHISGAHYNPAVSAAVLMRGHITAREMFAYWGAQVGGAVLAALWLPLLLREATPAVTEFAAGPQFFGELLFTFLLAYVILNVATAAGTRGNSHYGLSIGFTVMVGIYAVGGVSGAVFNPAVAVGGVVLGLLAVGSLWVYLLATFGGAAMAAALFNAFNLGDDKPTAATRAQQRGLKPVAEPVED